MEQLNIANGGVQYIPQITAVQYVYLDFDGELTSYNGELLTVENVEVLHSELTEERIENILDELNRKYAAEDVIFVTRRPENVEYSTIYIGKTSAFDEYGSFTGLAETLDTNNENKTDKAFVILDNSASDEAIAEVIAHEAEHITGTLNHGGNGLQSYATTYQVTGYISNKKLLGNFDKMYIYSGGTASNITVSSAGTIHISSGGVADKTSVCSHGLVNVYNGGIANNTLANETSASIVISSGGIANNTSVFSYAQMHIKNGGVANNTSAACYGYYVGDARIFVSSGGTVNDTILNQQVGSSIPRLTIYSGGIANRTKVTAGSMYIASGGTALAIKENGGYVDAANGAIVSFVSNTISGGTCSQSSMTVHSNTVADNVTIAGKGHLHVFSGGIANNTVVSGSRYMNYSSDWITEYAYVHISGGTANDTLIKAYGSMNITNDGIANSTTVNSYGSLSIADGGLANYTENSGVMHISSGGTVIQTNVKSYGKMCIYSGAAAEKTTVDIGEVYVDNGGKINHTVLSSGGKLNISSGATAYLTTVSSGGKINLFGTHTGRMLIRYGGVVSAYSGSIIDFTVAGRTSADDSLISDLSLIIGDPTFTITVSANQADGTYRLARGAEEFTGTITIGDGTTEYGAVTVNGDSLLYNNRFYTLIQNDGNLLLNVNTLPAVFIYSSGTLVSSGGEINNTIISGGGNNLMHISSGGIVNSTTVKSGGEMHISSGGVANSTTVDTYWGLMYISSGGVANNTTVNSWGNVYILGGVANNTTVDHGFMYISSGGVANNTVNENGGMYISSGGVHQGNLIIRNGAWLYAYDGGIIDFTLVDRTAEDAPLINDISRISGTPTYTITVSANQTSGTYKLARGAKYFTGTLTIGDGSVEYGSVEVNGSKLFYNANSYQLKEVKGDLTLTVVVNYVLATANSAEWNFAADSFTAELHRTGVEGSLVLDNITEKSFFTYGMPTGSYQWSVSAANDKGISDLFAVTASGKAEQYIAAQDSRFDLFFGNAKGIWLDGYAAEHTGSTDGWSGTGDKVYLTGKNKIADIFVGSDDANVLVLTDDRNGDALFVDDVYSAFPDEIEAQARIAGINEIRAGAGNDIIDLTSQLFEYVGDGVTIYGGAGNDTIWANSGENQLFGDAGNDRIVGGSDNDIIVGGAGNDSMHGGGGSDTFCFGENWGIDTVEQLAYGEVILWFETGSEDFWNAETMTYSDGTNRVTLKGVTADAVTLKFGDVESAIAGAFENAASEKIFEDKSKALIA